MLRVGMLGLLIVSMVTLVSFDRWRTLQLVDAKCSLVDCGSCGPDVCLNDPRYPSKLAAKKKSLTVQGFPNELVSLLDRDGKCVMAIDQAPDTFRILLVAANGDNSSIEWTTHDEDIAKNDLVNGALKEYYKYNVRKVFACCGEKKAEDRPDWDANLGLSKGQAIKCNKERSSVVCK